MTSNDLKIKWLRLFDNSITSGFRSLRLSSSCICELFIGVNVENSRCLILLLHERNQVKFKRVSKENLAIEYYPKTKLIVLQLLNPGYNDLFDDLIISMYHGIKDISNEDNYTKYFIQSFYRWNEFFENKNSDLLSEESLRGLFGELIILKSILEKESNVDEILSSWKGPYDKGHDFEFNSKNIEVKTKSPSGIDIKISSEFQLELPAGKGLELIVLSLTNDDYQGVSIGDLVFEIIMLIQLSSGDCSIFWSTLKQKNITFNNIRTYDGYKYKPIKRVTYNCAFNEFPRLCRTNIPIEINSLKFNLRTNLLTQFIIEEFDYEHGY